ncbi:hypothetical protein D3C72_643870 [compost metagenome]
MSVSRKTTYVPRACAAIWLQALAWPRWVWLVTTATSPSSVANHSCVPSVEALSTISSSYQPSGVFSAKAVRQAWVWASRLWTGITTDTNGRGVGVGRAGEAMGPPSAASGLKRPSLNQGCHLEAKRCALG